MALLFFGHNFPTFDGIKNLASCAHGYSCPISTQHTGTLAEKHTHLATLLLSPSSLYPSLSRSLFSPLSLSSSRYLHKRSTAHFSLLCGCLSVSLSLSRSLLVLYPSFAGRARARLSPQEVAGSDARGCFSSNLRAHRRVDVRCADVLTNRVRRFSLRPPLSPLRGRLKEPVLRRDLRNSWVSAR